MTVTDLVIFDCDGVLVDSEPLANRVFSGLLAREGLKLTVDEVMRRFVGKTKAGCIELAGQMLGRSLPARFGDDWDDVLYAALRRELKPVEGIAALIAELRVPYCVATNSSPERLHLALETTGLAPFFQGRAFTASEVARPKPAPDLFLHAAKKMGAEPSRCVVVEDTPTGARAARAAGMAVLGFAAAPHTDAEGLRREGATLVRSVNELATRLVPVTLRPARQEDAPAISECIRASYQHYVARIGTTPRPMTLDYAEVMREHAVTVAEAGGRLAGVLVLSDGDEGFKLFIVGVHPEFQGRGVGRALLEFAEAEARRQGHESIYLSTQEKMTENQALYAKIGYREYARRVEDGYSRVYMRKALPPTG